LTTATDTVERFASVTRLTTAYLELLVEIERSRAIPFDQKEGHRERAKRAYDLMWGGMKPLEIRQDGTVVWPSKPGRPKSPGESEGHIVTGTTCTCDSAQKWGGVCWARYASYIVRRVPLIVDVIGNDPEKLFDDGHPEPPRAPIVPMFKPAPIPRRLS
jgi:hypothetical protein